MKFKVVSGYVIAFGVLGFTSYAIYKHLKNKEDESKVISSEEAISEIARYRNSKMDGPKIQEDFEETMDDRTDRANINGSFISYNGEEGEEDVDDEDDEDVDEEETPDEISEEVEKLKHDPNSQEARQQFINMELSDFRYGDETYHTLLQLFNFPFDPLNDGDHDLKTKLIDYRVQFFGFGSVWAMQVSFAEVILYYAKAATYNYDESVKYWVDYFLQFNGMSYKMSSNSLDGVIKKLNEHSYHNTDNPMVETWGLFGLTNVAMDNAIRIAGRNVDNSVTYEIEFNEFLKSFS